MDDITNAILKFRKHDMDVVMAVPRMDKLVKISSYMPCRILSCVCHKWISNEKNEPSMNSICDQSQCNHKLYDHVTHLVHAPEKMLNALIRLIFDFENINEEIEYRSKEASKDERDALLKQCKGFIYNEIKNFIRPESMGLIEDSIEKPPFESPSMADILKHFCLYKFSLNFFELQIAFQFTRITLDNFNLWIWVTPEKLPFLNKLKFNNSYKFYYQKYQEHCLTPEKLSESSIIFGKDILRYTLKVFRTTLTNWCIKKSKNCTFIKKCFLMKIFPNFLDLLEEEVYAIDSPIWDPNFTNKPSRKKILDDFNLKLNELAQSQYDAPRMNSNMSIRIKNNILNRIPFKIPDVEYDKMFKNYVSTDAILELFKSIHFDAGANTSLKSLIKKHDKLQIQEKGKHLGIEMIVIDCLSNNTKSVLCRKELKNIYKTRLPRLPDTYIARLQTDKQIKTLAMLEDGIPIGGIYFRTFNSQGFTEIILCMFKIDLHVNGYESSLMNYLKDLHIKQNILDLLVYVDKEKFAFFKSHDFSSEVKIKKKKYNKYIVHYEDSKLMHCNLKK
ncbi:hypothetical protein QTP88_025426 [Uroleucon formosanum]